MKYLLLDIEGTTTSVSFVYDTLFPFFSAHFRSFAGQNMDDPVVQEQLDAVIDTVKEETGTQIDRAKAVDILMEWTKADRKHTALKNLQGIVWKDGYASGELKGHIYPDVLPALKRWKDQGLQIGIYSSGSVPAQKLLFGHSIEGDLLPYFSHHFDTRVGHKREEASYHNISEKLGLPAQEILFLSDVEAELDAAKAAGFNTLQIVRPGTVASEQHPTATDFSTVSL